VTASQAVAWQQTQGLGAMTWNSDCGAWMELEMASTKLAMILPE